MVRKSLVPIELPDNAVNPLEAVPKQQFDLGLAVSEQTRDFKQAVKVATTVHVGITGAQTIDGYAVANGDRVLVKNHATPSSNGIYDVNTAGAWTRSVDADQSLKLHSGAAVYVERGTIQAKTGWWLTTQNPITPGTTSQTWEQFAPAVPIGTIMMWAVATPPSGWLLCDGIQSITGYPVLAALLSPATVTPNLAGKFPLGVGTSTPSGTSRTLGSSSGADERTLVANNLPLHTHTWGPARETTNTGGPQDGTVTSGGVGGAVHNPNTSNGGFANNAFGIMPPYLALNFIIKAA